MANQGGKMRCQAYIEKMQSGGHTKTGRDTQHPLKLAKIGFAEPVPRKLPDKHILVPLFSCENLEMHSLKENSVKPRSWRKIVNRTFHRIKMTTDSIPNNFTAENKQNSGIYSRGKKLRKSFVRERLKAVSVFMPLISKL